MQIEIIPRNCEKCDSWLTLILQSIETVLKLSRPSNFKLEIPIVIKIEVERPISNAAFPHEIYFQFLITLHWVFPPIGSAICGKYVQHVPCYRNLRRKSPLLIAGK